MQMNPNTISLIGLALGSGIFVLLFRISFQFGNYATRLEILEKHFGKYSEKLEIVDRNVTILLTTSIQQNPKKFSGDS